MSLDPPTEPKIYTARHLQLQICMYMIEHHAEVTKRLKENLQADGTSLAHFIFKHSKNGMWGEECMLWVVHDMWNINISVINVTLAHHQPLTHYSKYQDFLCSDIYIIFNGTGHYTGTGANPFTCPLYG